jgi:hypothetical protein
MVKKLLKLLFIDLIETLVNLFENRLIKFDIFLALKKTLELFRTLKNLPFEIHLNQLNLLQLKLVPLIDQRNLLDFTLRRLVGMLSEVDQIPELNLILRLRRNFQVRKLQSVDLTNRLALFVLYIDWSQTHNGSFKVVIFDKNVHIDLLVVQLA